MEHRWCKRWRLALGVQLTSKFGTRCVASTRNVSMDGMFIEVPPDKLFGAKLVQVKLPAAAGVRRLKSFVVHSCEQGVGLMFCTVESEDRRRLARYLAETNQQRGE